VPLSEVLNRQGQPEISVMFAHKIKNAILERIADIPVARPTALL
jgi:hypothetical protein